MCKMSYCGAKKTTAEPGVVSNPADLNENNLCLTEFSTRISSPAAKPNFMGFCLASISYATATTYIFLMTNNTMKENEVKTNSSDGTPKEDEASDAVSTQYLSGVRLYIMTFGLCLGVYLVHVEITILCTSLLAITNSLDGFAQAGWIISGYLITYTGFIVIWSKLSDVVGRKTCVMTTMAIFVLFSAGCGAAQNITQLIICRVFQGVGAAGGFSLTMTVCYEMVPKNKYPLYQAIMAATAALAALTGPLFGGLISEHTTWRWVFLLNVPSGTVALLILFFGIPAGFPNHTANSNPFRSQGPKKDLSAKAFERLDVLGATLLLASTLLLVTGLLEGGVEFPWKSGATISLLVISGLVLIPFLIWERIVTSDNWKQEPVFPWRFFSSLLNGIPFYTIVFTLPQRIQNTNHLSPFDAAVRIIPLSVGSASGGVLASIVTGTGRIAPIYLLWGYSVLTAIGTSLLTTLPSTVDIPRSFYGYEFLAGFGLGGTFSIPMLVIPYVVETRDLATASGAYYEFRILGGAIGLAIATTVFNNYIGDNLSAILAPEVLQALLQSTFTIEGLPEELKGRVAKVLAEGYNLQMRVTTGFAVAQIFTLGLLWRKNQIRVVEKKVS
ncbi:hypothetical protein HYALB_00011013 [Hymenoscyphus albidus]|uniref:Major facilitator superfamily (MFS) profile domain-containing protein n=1 Tax=Hymenoscyphus albidus TaxID=595503 RepID=A0A9N9LS42_9HELO|nr:hypothetical protein HYALB_00011013 [Hymenoscyphus albidus]